MARGDYAPQVLVRAGVVPTANAAVADGEGFDNALGDVIILITNGAGAPITATFVTPGTVDGLAITDLPVTVTNGTSKAVGPFPPSIYNQANGQVYVNWSAHADVTFSVLRVVPDPH